LVGCMLRLALVGLVPMGLVRRMLWLLVRQKGVMLLLLDVLTHGPKHHRGRARLHLLPWRRGARTRPKAVRHRHVRAVCS
jgi:hypothetical protein